MAKIFMDASYAIALSATTDRYHKLAEMLAVKMEAEGTQLIIVMQERGLTEALTTDKHFQQAGFNVLLDEEQIDAD